MSQTDNQENVFTKCPKYAKDLHEWSTMYPSIKDAIVKLDKNRESVSFYDSAKSLANVIYIENPDCKPKDHIIKYAFTEDSILEIISSYAEDSLTPELDKDLRSTIVISRETALQERSYINNIVKEWNEYDVPTVAEKGYYYLSNAGVFRVVDTINEETLQHTYITKEVCRTPFIICGISEPLSDDTVYYKIRYATYNGIIKEFWASQNILLSRKELKTFFNSKGINCPENSILLETLDYISRSIAEFGPHLKKEFSAKRNGWNEDFSIFVLGDRGITLNGINKVLSITENSKGFPELEKRGTLDGWINGVLPLLDYDIIRFKMYDALTAPLNALLGVESHVTDHYGNTSCGKTLSAWIALSMVGNAEGLTIGAKSTAKGILVHIRDFSDLPILIDESSDAGEHLTDIVYPLTSNKGRVKSTQTGQRDGGEEYHTSTMFTGEKPVRDCLPNSGQQYRVNELDDTLPDLPTKIINNVKHAIRENSGHIIELYLKELFAWKESGQLQTAYDINFDALPSNTSNIEGRSRSIFACIMTAGNILEQVFKRIGVPNKNAQLIVKHYFKKCIQDKPIELEYIRALRLTLDWVHSDYGKFIEVDKVYDEKIIRDKVKIYGYVDNEFIDIIGSEFTTKMKAEGFSPTKIKEDWHKQGIICTNDPKRPGTYRFTRFKKTIAGLRIDRAIAEELTGLNYVDMPKVESEPCMDTKVKNLLETIQFLTSRKGEAEIQLIRQIENISDLDNLLSILVTNGKIIKASQTTYQTLETIFPHLK